MPTGPQSSARLTLYAAISAIEMDLRNFISLHTPSQDPFDFLGSDLHATCLDRAAQDADTPSATTVDDLLSYVDFADHFHLINKHRSQFPSPAASHIRRITPNLEALLPVRNRVMHSRPLAGGDLPTTLDLIERLAAVDVGLWTAVRVTLDRLRTDPGFIYQLRIPVLATPDERVAHNLPTSDFDETGFIGRDQFVQDTIKAILGPYPVISILGEGGIGKSAVALKVAYDILDREDCPFELIVWSTSKTHQLTGTEITKISESIASSLDLISDVAEGIGSGGGTDPVEGLLEDLQALPTLLILDNLETVLDERIKSFLGRLPSGCKVLVTSRIGIGAFEYPLRLEAMDRDDTVVLMRALAKVRQVDGLVKCSNTRLIKYTRRLYNNPGFIKWFVAGVQAGTRPEELLANPKVFLDFCLSNVYQYLSEDAKTTLRCLVALMEASQADIGYYAGIDGLRLTEAINGLMSTNMVSNHFVVSERATYDTYYRVREIASRYLSKHHPLSAQELNEIQRKRRKIVAVQEEIAAAGRRDPYQRKAIFLRSRRDIVPAKYLRAALRASRQGDDQGARKAVESAGALAPEYFEVYRVEGIISAEGGRILEAAAAFERALEFREDFAPLLYAYSLFLMRYRNDNEGAASAAARAHELDSESSAVAIQLARARLYEQEFTKVREVLKPLQEKRDRLTVRDAKIVVDLYMQAYMREGDTAVHDRDLKGALEIWEEGRRFLETIPEALIDRRLRQHLRKATLSASWMVDGIEKQAPGLVRRAGDIKGWISRGGTTPGERRGGARFREGIVYGKVVRLPVRERYGFLEGDDGSELFFHRQSLEVPAEWEALSLGAGLSFRVERDDEGRLRAAEVRVEHPGHVIREDEGRELEGMVRTLLRDRRFGFVRAFEGPTYFFHLSSVDDQRRLNEGSNVAFIVGTNPRDGGICAQKVRVL